MTPIFHYHLLLETPEPNLVAGMKWFQGTYTLRFNARHRLSGHLFQGRYSRAERDRPRVSAARRAATEVAVNAIPVQAEAAGYFCAASEYIHLNPARAGLSGGMAERRQSRIKSRSRAAGAESFPFASPARRAKTAAL